MVGERCKWLVGEFFFGGGILFGVGKVPPKFIVVSIFIFKLLPKLFPHILPISGKIKCGIDQKRNIYVVLIELYIVLPGNTKQKMSPFKFISLTLKRDLAPLHYFPVASDMSCFIKIERDTQTK